MPRTKVIRWRDGAGWLVLSGGELDSADSTEIEAEALARVPAGDPLAYIWAAGDVESADHRLATFEDLGAPTGFLVDVLTEDDETLRRQLADSGIIVIGDGPNLGGLRSGLLGAALEGIGEAYERGAVVLGIGQGAAVLGSILVDSQGLGWVDGAAIVPGYERESEAARLRELLTQYPEAYGLGIGAGSALGLGPGGEIATWGKGQVTVTLGRNFA